MSDRKNTPFVYTLIATTLVLYLFAKSPDTYAACQNSNLSNKFICHFFHANIIHWLANAWCFYLMRPSPHMMVLAYILAVASMFVAPNPTVGMSGILYAYIGLKAFYYNLSREAWYTFGIINLITIFIPGVAFTVHAVSFFQGLLVSFLVNQYNRSR